MHSHLLRAHSNCNTCTLLVVCNKCRCTHAILQPTVISICRLPAIPPPAMPDRRWYQYWPSWHNYGTKRFWERIAKEPWNALELIAQRLFRAGLECPAEATSADIAAAILVLQRGPAAAAMATTDELTAILSAFKVRSARMHAPRHPCIKHKNLRGHHRGCACAIYFVCICALSILSRRASSSSPMPTKAS